MKSFLKALSLGVLLSCSLIACNTKNTSTEASSEISETSSATSGSQSSDMDTELNNEETLLNIKNNLPEGIEIPNRTVRSNEVVFKKTREKSLKMIINYPLSSSSEKSPVIFMITGGGFHTGDRTSMISFFYSEMNSLLQDNYTVCSIDYRLLGDSVSMSQIVSDCMDGLRYLYIFQEEMNIDVEQINVCGHSAGGFLTLGMEVFNQELFYAQSPYPGVKFDIKNVAALSPVGSIHSVNGVEFAYDAMCINAMNGLFQREDFDFDIENICPYHCISSSMCRTLVVHGTADPLVNYAFSEEIVKKGQSLGVDISLLTAVNGQHCYEDKDASRKSSLSLPDVCKNVHNFFNNN